MTIQGSCLCQKIQFSIPEQILWSAHCHCSLCRKAQGAAFVTWVGIAKKDLHIQQGTHNIRWFESSAQGRRAHCSHCASPLFFEGDPWPDEIHITRASLDSELPHPVECHAFYHSHVNWTQADPQLPKKG